MTIERAGDGSGSRHRAGDRRANRFEWKVAIYCERTLLFLERISRLIFLSHSWTLSGVLLEVGNRVDLQGIHPRQNDRARPLRRPLAKDRSSKSRTSVNNGDRELAEQH